MKFKKHELDGLRCDNFNRLIEEYEITKWIVRDPELFLKELEEFLTRCQELDNQLLNLEIEDDTKEGK